jgi:hypothetical protein
MNEHTLLNNVMYEEIQACVNCANLCTYHMYPMIKSNMTMFSFFSSSGIGCCKGIF